MIKETREYVIECEHTSGDVWTPVGLYAIDGTNPRVVRCWDCKHGGLDQTEHEFRKPIWCGLWGVDRAVDWFCASGAPKENKEGKQ